jgi:hypothetical protein
MAKGTGEMAGPEKIAAIAQPTAPDCYSQNPPWANRGHAPQRKRGHHLQPSSYQSLQPLPDSFRQRLVQSF